MIDASKLALAGVHTSKNSALKGLWLMIVQYNQLPPTADTRTKSELLHLILRLCGDYLTSKPPQHTYLSQLRWEALGKIAEQAGAEAAASGIKTINGPADYRQMSSGAHSYWLELLDPEHRPGFALSPLYANWLTNPHARATRQSFWEFIGTKSREPEFQSDVAYLNQGNGASKFLAGFGSDGLLRENGGTGDRFSSSHDSTHFSGKGWSIWVCSPTREIYLGSHIVGKLHHSSFLGGRPVMAAGEMVVRKGLIRVVTGKSGHYRPSPDDLRRFVTTFSQIPDGAVIRPDMTDDRGGGTPKYYFVKDFRALGPGARPLNRQGVLSVLPRFARSPKFDTQLAAIPPRVTNRIQRKLGLK